MGLNIVASRKMSLKGFAQGWDDCFLIVRAINETLRAQYEKRLTEAGKGEGGDAAAVAVLREVCLEVIESGRIINTDEAGNQAPYDFTKSEVPDVVEALNFSWQGEVVSIATGSDRLKATISSV